MSKLQTAKTIKTQIDSLDPRALFSYGAKDYIGSEPTDKHNGFLMFSVGGTRLYKQRVRVKITLEYNDTYTVEVYRVRGVNVTDLFKMTDVYCDMLVDVLDTALEGK